MEWLFNILLKKHSKKEVGRILIHHVLQEQVRKEYSEQTLPGNTYNNQLEVIMSNKVIRKAVKSSDDVALKMYKANINNAFDKAIEYIENDYIYPID